VVVERRLGDLCFGNDAVDADSTNALGVKEFCRRIDQPTAGRTRQRLGR
jgi:hypothetical protein